MPSNPDTHYTTHIYVGDNSSNTGNATTSNGGTYLKLFDNTTACEKIKITGSGTVGVASSGDTITITGESADVSVPSTVPTLS